MGEGDEIAQVTENINRVVLTLIGILSLQAVIAYFRVRGFIKAGESALNDIRKDLFAKMIRLPIPFYQEHRSGELSGRLSSDLGVLRDTLLTTVPQLVRQTVILLGGLVFIFICSVKLSLFMLGVIPVVLLAVAVIGKRIKGYSKASQDELAASHVVVEEAVQGIQEVKAFGNEAYEEGRYQVALERFLQQTLKGAQARASFISFIIFVMFGVISVVAWFGARMLALGEISSDQFSQFILFSIFIGASFMAFPEIMSQIQKANGATERLREILSEEEELLGETHGPKVGSLSAHEISFRYPSRPETKVLEAVSFEAKRGQKLAFVGPSGAGKSTLFSLLLGFYHPEEGELRFDGKLLSELGLTSVRNSMAVVPQDVLLFGGSIMENIAYGAPGASEEEVMEAAKKAYAHDFISDFPEGYETLVGPRGVKLSGGQRQRVAIARAVLADPQILLLDEATSALDSESEVYVQKALSELMEGRTSLIIAHRLSTVKEVDQIHVLQEGRVVESGTHSQLLAKQGVYAVLAETQLLA